MDVMNPTYQEVERALDLDLTKLTLTMVWARQSGYIVEPKLIETFGLSSHSSRCTSVTARPLRISSLACKADAKSFTIDNTGGRSVAPFHPPLERTFVGLLPSCASSALYNVFTVRAPQPTGDELLTDDRGAVGRIADRPVPAGPDLDFAQNVAAPSGRSRGSKAATSPFCAHGNAGQMVG